MQFDLTHVPFSRRGSRFCLRRLAPSAHDSGGLFLNYLAHNQTFRLEPLRHGVADACTIEADPRSLVLRTAHGSAEIVFETDKRLRLRVDGLTLRLSANPGMFNYILPRGEHRWQINLFHANSSFLLTGLHGAIQIDAPWEAVQAAHMHVSIDGEHAPAEAALEYFTTTAPREAITAPFADVCERAPEGFAAFLAGLPAAPTEFQDARALAGYILWSAIVAPGGNLRRETLLMSKNHMTQVWSWDNCFNAMALAAAHPDLAWDQLMVVFDHQDADGALPDSLNHDRISWNFCKPPVHGWALLKMLEFAPALAERVPDIFDRLARWTDWWFDTRDDDGDGMPQYNHGNDSGWDNATCFALTPPLEGPDLAAFLITQLDALAALAPRVGRDPAPWRARADRLQQVLFAHAWDGERFRARRSGSHETPAEGDSLIPFMPLLLGERLPADVRARLLAGVREDGRFLTPWGPATESPRSPLYEPDGYWRGPIWAPSTYLLYDGLRRCGETALARNIAERFCRLCAHSGMAENFDALTGAPLRDKAYTWTASVFLLLANDLMKG